MIWPTTTWDGMGGNGIGWDRGGGGVGWGSKLELLDAVILESCMQQNPIQAEKLSTFSKTETQTSSLGY